MDDGSVAAGISLLAIGVAGGWLWLLRPRWAVVALVVGWLAVTAGIAASGGFERFTPPPPLFFALLAALAFVGIVSRRADVDAVPLVWLVGLQAFRLPLELVMHHAATIGLMPVQMSFSGRNLDIVSGITAAVVAPLVASGRASAKVVRAWNLLGTALLLNIMGVAILSLPSFAFFGDDPARLNTWIAGAPYVWLPTVLVPSALLGHLLVARKLGWLGGRG